MKSFFVFLIVIGVSLHSKPATAEKSPPNCDRTEFKFLMFRPRIRLMNRYFGC